MNCEHIEDLFSARFDGDLADRDCDAFDSHVAGCADCHASWTEYREAVGLLRASGRLETSPDLAAATLAAVAEASATPRVAPRALPLLFAALAGAAAALLVAWLIMGIDGSRTIDISVGADVVALRPGETRSAGGILLSRSATGDLTARAEPAVPTIVERVVEIPIERLVERLVEVRVEVPVEVIVRVPVEVAVQRGPLFTFDVTSLCAALRAAGQQVGSGMLALAAARIPPPPQQTTAPRAEAPRSPIAQRTDRPDRPATSRGASLRLLRTDGRMMLETSGTLEELVPTLLAQLSSPDPELTSLIERQLAIIHQQAARDPAIRKVLAAMPQPGAEPITTERSPFGGRRESTATASPAAAWAAWWDANSALITRSASLLTAGL